MKKRLSEVIRMLYDFWLKSLSDKEVEGNYIEAGAKFREAASYDYLGECSSFKDKFLNWAKWELEYSRRGYKTISLNDFVSYKGYEKSLKDLGVKREINERAVLHAVLCRKRYLL